VIANAIDCAAWPLGRFDETLAQLALSVGLPVRERARELFPSTADDETLDAWVDATALAMGLEARAIDTSIQELELRLAGAAPAILRIGDGSSARLLALLRVDRRTAQLLAPEGHRVRVPTPALLVAARGHEGPELSERVERLLARAAVPARRRARVREALVNRMMAGRPLRVGWSLGLPASAPFMHQLQDAGVFSSAVVALLGRLLQQLLGVVGWWMVGRGALQGQLATGWLVAWALVLVSVIPVQVLASWAQGTATLALAIRIKRRLLNGALSLAPEEVRRQGSGTLLGRVIESGAFEALIANDGLATLAAAAETVVASAVLSLGPAGSIAASVFGAYLAAVLALSSYVARRVGAWTRMRLTMTQNLVEGLVGHRTRLAQEPRDRWHALEDEQLARYMEHSGSLDRLAVLLLGAVPRTWLVLGLATLAPAFARGTATSAGLAVSLGGLLLGWRALGHLTPTITALLRARSAWQEVRPLFQAGAREERLGSVRWAAARRGETAGEAVEVHDLHFHYADRHKPVLRGLSLRLGPRDRVLIAGASGSGKSTLAAVLSGLRSPDSGLVLIGGLDRHTIGDRGWHRRVVSAPQFHENHLLCASLAFNLLMGRRWPPRDDDIERAREVCNDLGLGPLLERMPSGIMQPVGETGWQLSHGEQSRVFIARALLQGADLVVLDESVAALDPETLERSMLTVWQRSPTLVVIAHL
jgi:ATP-binding cassette subfamily B protein